MNERDKELYVLATGKEWAYDFDTDTAEKFADLIRADEREKLTEAAMQSAEKSIEVAMGLERDGCIYATEIALLGADKALSDRVIKAIQARGNK